MLQTCWCGYASQERDHNRLLFRAGKRLYVCLHMYKLYDFTPIFLF